MLEKYCILYFYIVQVDTHKQNQILLHIKIKYFHINIYEVK